VYYQLCTTSTTTSTVGVLRLECNS